MTRGADQEKPEFAAQHPDYVPPPPPEATPLDNELSVRAEEQRQLLNRDGFEQDQPPAAGKESVHGGIAQR